MINVLVTYFKKRKTAVQKMQILLAVFAFACLSASAFYHLATKTIEKKAPDAIAGIALKISASDAQFELMSKNSKPWEDRERDISSLVKDVRNDNILAVSIQDNDIFVSTKDRKTYHVKENGYEKSATEFLKKEYESLPEERLFALKQMTKKPPSMDDMMGGKTLIIINRILGIIFPLLIIGFLIYFVSQHFKKGVQMAEKPNVKFSDVIGAHEAKTSLNDIRQFLEDPSVFESMKVKPPRGVLLSGPPGVGKTLLAKALAGECGVNFIAVTGSHFSSQYYGIGIAKVKSLFAYARKNAPCILWVDEIDGIGKRMSQQSASDSEANRIINQILAEMDGFSSSEGVIVIGATNHPSSIDEALLREGRFDRKISLSLPTVDDREQLFKYYSNKRKFGADVDFKQLARLSVGMAPAAIEFVNNHAALLAIKNNRDYVAMADFLESLDTSRMGEAKVMGRPMVEEDRRRIAVHEAGHALIAAHLNSGNVERVTILPRGNALGVTLVTNENDIHLYSKQQLKNRIMMLLSGRNAERLFLGEISSGASGDIEEAFRLAYGMITMYGMDKDVLFSAKAAHDLQIKFDADFYVRKANDLLLNIDNECFTLLQTLKAQLQSITDELLEKETIPGAFVTQCLKDKFPIAA